MMSTSLRLVLGAAVLFIASCAGQPTSTAWRGEPSFAREAVQEDFDRLINFITSTHPDLARSGDLDALKAVTEDARRAMPARLSLREAWMAMAVINPVLGDAHTGLRRPTAAVAAFQEQGGVLFPAPVVVDQNGTLRIAPNAPIALGAQAGEEVLEINGIHTDAIFATLTPRMRGESDALRQMVMARYFDEYFWLAYGGFDSYRVRLKNGDGHERTVSLASVPVSPTSTPAFHYERMSPDVAYIDMPTFELRYKVQFESFLEKAFGDIRASGARALIIDLRANGGGARDLSDMLVGYLSRDPVATTSGITARVTAENAGRLPGTKLGDVVRVPFQQMTALPAGDVARFEGAVYVLVGKLTYSQAIVFASTLQDHGLAVIAGEETEGPANQTAQVQTLTLPETGLEALAPLYVFTRPRGDPGTRGIIPDILIEDDPVAPARSVEKLMDLMQRMAMD